MSLSIVSFVEHGSYRCQCRIRAAVAWLPVTLTQGDFALVTRVWS